MKESGKREEEKNFAKGADDDDTGSVVDAALLQNKLVKKNTEGYLGLKSLRAEKKAYTQATTVIGGNLSQSDIAAPFLLRWDISATILFFYNNKIREASEIKKGDSS